MAVQIDTTTDHQGTSSLLVLPGNLAQGEEGSGATATHHLASPFGALGIDREKVLPLPGWLVKVYFIFPVVLYVPDAIFNYYVYSDGARLNNASPVFQAGQVALWGFLSIGVVGMAYLLSVLAPWHWGQGHKLQALFCGLGVLVATAITTWNSLSYRSTGFSEFPTDRWAYSLFPQLQAYHVSVTMILVAVAPPFWGLFWAIVQPTQTGRSLAQLQESHAERLLRMQQEAELKRLRAETNAKIREAQLKSLARTAAAAREQASGLFGRSQQSVATPPATASRPAVAPHARPVAEGAGGDGARPSAPAAAAGVAILAPAAGSLAQREPGAGATGEWPGDRTARPDPGGAQRRGGRHRAPSSRPGAYSALEERVRYELGRRQANSRPTDALSITRALGESLDRVQPIVERLLAAQTVAVAGDRR